MATKLKEPETVEEPGDTDTGVNDEGGEEQSPRDFDAEARQHGWVPQDEFKGDPARWVDAETFATRADEVMPLLKKANAQMKREMADMKKQTRRITEQFTRAEERIRAELIADMEAAVESGDVRAFKAAQKKADDLGKNPAKPEYTKAEATDAFNRWRDDNPWYDRGLKVAAASETEQAAALYAERMTEEHLADTANMAPEAFFGMIGDLVKERFPTVGARAPRAKPGSDVAGATPGRSPRTNGKGFNDLPVEAQRAAEKWIKQGLIKDRAAYLASYDWS